MKTFLKINQHTLEYNLFNLSQLVFEVTEECNLNCTYCAFSDLYSERRESYNKQMDFATAVSVIDYMVSIWQNYSHIYAPKRLGIGFYGGEPTLNISLIEKIVEYVDSIRFKVPRNIGFSMTTNGVLLNKYIDFFVKHNFSLLVSLDGDELANSYRVDKQGLPSFHRVYNNLKMVQEKYPVYFEENIRFNSVLNNHSNTKSVIEFFKNNFDKRPSLSQLSKSYVNPESIDKYYEICNDFKKFNLVDSDKDETASFQIENFYNEFSRMSGNFYYDINELFYNREDFGIVPTGTCVPFTKKMFVTVHGKILQCERIDHKYYLGQVIAGKVAMDLNKVAERFNILNRAFIKQCPSCVYVRHCPKCMYRLNDVVGEKKCLSYVKSTENNNTLNLEKYRNYINQLIKGAYQIKIVR
ncbi:MAG: radical SAM peptide maturase [Lentimicrobiaceae bacterium]|nr:radical SAM peptide maturase [Lentimicrobiaceae bacterium]